MSRQENEMKLTLGKKLGIGFGIIVLLIIAMSAVVYVKLALMRDISARIVQVRAPTAFAGSSLTIDLTLTQKRAGDAMLAGLDTPATMEKTKKAMDESWQMTDKALADYEALSPKWTLQENRDRLAQLKQDIALLHQFQDAAVLLAQSKERDAVVKGSRLFNEKATPQSQKIRKTLSAMTDSQVKLLVDDQRLIDDEGKSLNIVIFIVSFLVVMISSFVALVQSRHITQASQAALQRAAAIAGGDLTGSEIAVMTNDELGDITSAINTMQSRLRTVIESISNNAQHVATASEQFSSTSQQITSNSEETSAQANVVSAATEEINRNLQTVATSTEEMSASISEIAKNATEAAKVAAAALEAANKTNATVTRLGDSSVEIGQVVKVINAIAQQTNLLALNATIEAARAGEAGKGFAVVANEVKELAKQTAKATEDISQRISAIQVDAKGAVEAIKTISGIIGQVNDISSTIATAVEEQSATTSEMSRNITEAAKGSGEVAKNITGVAQAAQNTSHGASESHKAAQSLAQMSTELRELVGQFKIDSSGNGHSPRAAA